MFFPHNPTKKQGRGDRCSQFFGTNLVWSSGMMTSGLFAGGSPSYKVCAVTQHSLRTLAFPGPRLHQQALGKASEETVSWATGHAVVNQRHQSRLSTQMPLQLMQSCLVSALRVGTQKQPQRIFHPDKSKTSFCSLSQDVCVCLFSFFKFTQKGRGW